MRRAGAYPAPFLRLANVESTALLCGDEQRAIYQYDASKLVCGGGIVTAFPAGAVSRSPGHFKLTRSALGAVNCREYVATFGRPGDSMPNLYQNRPDN
ncbi:hypothetical protein LAUMK41_03446 [Mycobacterium attenuatum]|nr:hypothetical protein LAUMK41_03446 [Mycobacterium attenuatum]